MNPREGLPSRDSWVEAGDPTNDGEFRRWRIVGPWEIDDDGKICRAVADAIDERGSRGRVEIFITGESRYVFGSEWI